MAVEAEDIAARLLAEFRHGWRAGSWSPTSSLRSSCTPAGWWPRKRLREHTGADAGSVTSPLETTVLRA